MPLFQLIHITPHLSCVYKLPTAFDEAYTENWYYDYKSADTYAITSCLCSFYSDILVNSHLSCQDLTTSFYYYLYLCIDQFVPKRNKWKSTFPSWFSRELKTAIYQKKGAHARFKQSNLAEDYLVFSNLRRDCKILAKRDFDLFNRKTEDFCSSSPKNFWRYVNSKKNNNTLPNVMKLGTDTFSNAQAIADAFAKHFSTFYQSSRIRDLPPKLSDQTPYTINSIDISLSDIFGKIENLLSDDKSGPDGVPSVILKNSKFIFSQILFIIFEKSIAEGSFPEEWKTSFILPIFKSGDKNDISNYRPISILSVIPKLFESIITDKLKNLFYPFLSTRQFGFMSKKSIDSNLIIYTQYILESLDEKVRVDSVYTDFSKAFDSVHHDILLQKLASFGITNNLLKWFSNYLKNRKQIVRMGTASSQEISVSSGVPQGSHLGPLLFIIFINDLSSILEDVEYLLFADDLKIFKSIRSNDDALTLQKALSEFAKWCALNDLNLNPAKCKFITFSRSRFASIPAYTLNSVSIEQVTSIRDLGVIFDQKMSFTEHINYTVNKANQLLGFIRRTCLGFTSVNTFVTLYNMIVKPILMYSSIVWSPIYTTHINKLESVQHKFFRIMAPRLRLPDPFLDHNYSSISNALNLPTLQSLRVLYDSLYLFKLINGIVDCSLLLGQINFRVPRPGSRNNAPFVLQTYTQSYTENNPLNRLCKTFNESEWDPYNLSLHRFKALARGRFLRLD